MVSTSIWQCNETVVFSHVNAYFHCHRENTTYSNIRICGFLYFMIYIILKVLNPTIHGHDPGRAFFPPTILLVIGATLGLPHCTVAGAKNIADITKTCPCNIQRLFEL